MEIRFNIREVWFLVGKVHPDPPSCCLGSSSSLAQVFTLPASLPLSERQALTITYTLSWLGTHINATLLANSTINYIND